MTNEQINRAVAEELGYYYIDGTGDGCIRNHGEAITDLPDFCNDYNAAAEMREAIKKDDEQVRFAQCLCDLTFHGHEDIMPEYYWTLINATPRQQAEAFLRMRGKLREG